MSIERVLGPYFGRRMRAAYARQLENADELAAEVKRLRAALEEMRDYDLTPVQVKFRARQVLEEAE